MSSFFKFPLLQFTIIAPCPVPVATEAYHNLSKHFQVFEDLSDPLLSSVLQNSPSSFTFVLVNHVTQTCNHFCFPPLNSTLSTYFLKYSAHFTLYSSSDEQGVCCFAPKS